MSLSDWSTLCQKCGQLRGVNNPCRCRTSLQEAFERISSTPLPTIGPPPPEPAPKPMTAAEFVHWLRGYFAAGHTHNLTQGDWKAIAALLQTVKT